MHSTIKQVIHLNTEDNVAVAVSALPSGTSLKDFGISCLDTIPAGHKIALRSIQSGEAIRKYGQVIGFASKTISVGGHVHTQNCRMGDFSRDYAMGMDAVETDYVPEEERLTFQGFVRGNGKVGTRNYIGVLATVSCSVSVARLIANGVPEERLSRFPRVDGIVSLGHGSGCGMADDHEAFSLLQRTLSGYTRNPDFAAIFLMGLGCEVNNLDCSPGKQVPAHRSHAADAEYPGYGGIKSNGDAGN